MLFKKWYNNLLDNQLRKERVVKIENKEGYYYPPPSAYAVKQITEEFNLNSHMVSRIEATPTPKHVKRNIDTRG